MKYLTISWEDFLDNMEDLREFSLLDEVIISVSDLDFSGRSIDDFIENCPGACITETPEEMLIEECADWVNNLARELK